MDRDSFLSADSHLEKVKKPDSEVHLPILDGIRGLAILMVLCFHTFEFPAHAVFRIQPIANLGRYGVDLFFCLSGFLITGILYDARGTKSYFRNFYLRRTLRIFPLYYLYLLVYYVAAVRLHVVKFEGASISGVTNELRWCFFYGTNILIAIRGAFITSSLNHFWTLAVEEHFYLFWPLLIYKLPWKNIMLAIGGICGVSLILRILEQRHGVPSEVILSFTLNRVDSFAIGGAASLLLRSPYRDRSVQFAKMMLWPALGVFLVANFLWKDTLQTFGYTALAVTFTTAIICAVAYEATPGLAIFRSAWLRFLGKYSYSLYVFHYPIRLALDKKLPIAQLAQRCHSLFVAQIVYTLIVGSVSVSVALMTWHFYEKQFLKLKRASKRGEGNYGQSTVFKKAAASALSVPNI
jgi:peptidoglycan/LPS O-acetylase OafA/YrhL